MIIRRRNSIALARMFLSVDVRFNTIETAAKGLERYFRFLIVAPSGIFTSNWLAGRSTFSSHSFHGQHESGFPPAGA